VLTRLRDRTCGVIALSERAVSARLCAQLFSAWAGLALHGVTHGGHLDLAGKYAELGLRKDTGTGQWNFRELMQARTLKLKALRAWHHLTDTHHHKREETRKLQYLHQAFIEMIGLVLGVTLSTFWRWGVSLQLVLLGSRYLQSRRVGAKRGG
jgi:hypothetical protein